MRSAPGDSEGRDDVDPCAPGSRSAASSASLSRHCARFAYNLSGVRRCSVKNDTLSLLDQAAKVIVFRAVHSWQQRQRRGRRTRPCLRGLRKRAARPPPISLPATPASEHCIFHHAGLRAPGETLKSAAPSSLAVIAFSGSGAHPETSNDVSRAICSRKSAVSRSEFQTSSAVPQHVVCWWALRRSQGLHGEVKGS